MSSLFDPNDNHGEDRDLAWLAFRYVAGELGAAQSAVFERRLGEDQVAREAVAEAVRIAGTVTSASKAIRRVSRIKTRALLATSACFFLVASFFVSRRPSEPASEAALAVAWSGITQSAEEIPERNDLVEESPFHDMTEAESTEGPPAWLVEAVALPVVELPREGQGS